MVAHPTQTAAAPSVVLPPRPCASPFSLPHLLNGQEKLKPGARQPRRPVLPGEDNLFDYGTVERLQLGGNADYNLVWDNCEDFANACFERGAGSEQVASRSPIGVYNSTESKIKVYLTNDDEELKELRPPAELEYRSFLLHVEQDAREIRCILEGHAPLMLEATGKCVSQPGETKPGTQLLVDECGPWVWLLEFFAQVRTKTQNSFIIRNPTDSDWKLYPQVATQEPAGASYFSCEKEIAVPAKKEATIQVFYMPLTMTADATGSPSKSARVEKHKGTVFVGTPDGSAVCYELEGEASPPEVGSRMEAKVPCKKKHTQAVPVKNWLHESFAGVVRRDRDPIFAAAQGAAKCPAQAIVILDAGARCKVGFGTNPISELIEFPAVVGRLRVQPVCMITSCVDRDVWVGEEAEEYRAILTLKQPVANGIVSDNREMEWIWRHCYKRLGVEAENHPLLLMESAWLPKDLRYWVLHKLMQDLEIPWLGLMNHATLSLYASGRTTGVVVDCGETGCRAIPVHDGFVISHAVNRSGFTGRDLTERLRRCLAETDRRFLKAQGRTDAERYKEEHCFVALDYEKERENARTALDKELFTCPELLFRPGIAMEYTWGGIHEAVHASIMECDRDIRQQMMENIVLAGGTSLFRNFPERLQLEMTQLLPGSKVIALENRKYLAWEGANLVATYAPEKISWISELEFGNAIDEDELAKLSLQRFNVTVELVSPEPGTAQAQGISLQGVGTLDLPPGLEREYRFSVYAYHEGTALVRVNLTSQETGEFMNIEVKLEFYAAESLATIKLEAAVINAQGVSPLPTYHLMLVDGLCPHGVRRQWRSSTGGARDLSAGLPAFNVRLLSLGMALLLNLRSLRPLEEGEGEAEVMLKSQELGTYPYTVSWRATPAGLERALVLKAPPGTPSLRDA
ncbi:unnamed protein product [Effrenium voratum]|nr:unnamed protein product [Effrenium voratum]